MAIDFGLMFPFEDKRSMIFVQDIWTGKRQRVAEFPGINSAPAWSSRW